MRARGKQQAGFSLPGSRLSKPPAPHGQVPAPLAERPLCSCPPPASGSRRCEQLSRRPLSHPWVSGLPEPFRTVAVLLCVMASLY